MAYTYPHLPLPVVSWLRRMERLVGQYLDTLLPAIQLFDKTFKFLLYNYLFHYQVNYGVALSIVIANLPVRREARYCFLPCLLGFFSFPRMTNLAWSYWEKETVLPNFIKKKFLNMKLLNLHPFKVCHSSMKFWQLLKTYIDLPKC